MLNSLLHLPKLNGSTFDMILYTSLSDAKKSGHITDFTFISTKDIMKDSSIVVTLVNGKVK